ncbi:hypothetical protein [Leeuwenhoekiella sp. H156]|uniref:hypothetical protein n=1 Tax=Leeuwenhoekiella sp. H156 TaxID=3450128 RepID=UPI003FA4891C
MSRKKFKIGSIVTLKSHPLAFQPNGEMDVYINQIPPFMCVKEIHIERNKKKFSDESHNKQIADNLKYLCVYFNQQRMIFEEKFVYHEMLLSVDDMTFNRANEKSDDYMTLIEETNGYDIAEYDFGKRVFFKTFKLERRKKFKKYIQKHSNDSSSSEASEAQYKSKSNLTHTSPAFILDGVKPNDSKSVYDTKTGRLKKKTAKTLYKVLWYNAYQEKFSQEYFPKDFFVDDENIYL